ncbi:CDP-alcohol phosphatidyltransferase family protein [candidate division KSB1 bacterium]|nr:CDP-alcohol phosphatidyltransferase family protein [candidate division KSB1 bacterium]
MPSIYDLKPKFQNLLRPLIKRLADFGLKPNAITLLALLGSIVVGVAVLQAAKHPAVLLLLPVWLFARMALNAIDGMMARELQMSTSLGAVLNELGDVLSDIGLYLPLAFLHEPATWPIVAFVLGATLTEFCGVLGRALGGSRHYEGPMGKSDRAFVVGAVALITVVVPHAMAFWPWIFSAATFLTAVTCWNRTSKALRELK